MLEAAGWATRRLLADDTWEGCLQEVLERLGDAASMSRAYVFQNDPAAGGELATSERARRIATRTLSGSLPDDGFIRHRSDGFPRWEQVLASGEAIAGPTSELPEPECTALTSRGIAFVAIAPIFAGPRWWGYLELCDHGADRRWGTTETRALRIVADVLGAAILRRETEMVHREREFRYRSLVERIPLVATYMDEVIVGEPGHSIPLYISPQIEHILGYPRDAWLAEDELWLRVLHPDDAERMTEEDANARRDLVPLTAQYRMIGRDGRVVWVSEKSAVVEDEDTGTLYWQGVMVDITEQKRVERELVDVRRKLLDQTVRASEEERMRLAADLHDGPVHALTRLGFLLERVRLQLDRGDVNGPREILDHATQDLRQETQRLRRMMSGLRPPILDQMGLASALRDHADAVGRDSGLGCVVEDAAHERLDPAVETILYRVAQEALANVVKHARANHAWLSLRSEDGSLVLEVRDDGVGFDPADTSTTAEGEHFGLIAMQQRVEMANGHWLVHSTPGAGTTVRAAIPRTVEGPS
jgi:two-component system sensor histidine kinase UhpB